MLVPLHVKSDFSLGYGTAGVEELAAAATLGYQTLALTDLENLCGQVRFHHECRCRGLRPLTGIELGPGFHGRQTGSRAGRVVLLAADRAGYASLCRLVAHRRGVAGPRQPQDLLDLVAHQGQGLFALGDDPAVVQRLLESFPRERLGLLLVRPAAPAMDWTRQEAAANVHSQRSLALRLEADGRSLFYSGDGRPTPATTALASGCDLAVHEAFRLHEDSEGHGSVRRCLDFSREAGVGRLALVHMAWTERRRERDLADLLGQAQGRVIMPEAGEEVRL